MFSPLPPDYYKLAFLFSEIKMMSKLSVVVASMSSIEIAELTGKRHDHVMNDIRKMLEDLENLTPMFSGVRKK